MIPLPTQKSFLLSSVCFAIAIAILNLTRIVAQAFSFFFAFDPAFEPTTLSSSLTPSNPYHNTTSPTRFTQVHPYFPTTLCSFQTLSPNQAPKILVPCVVEFCSCLNIFRLCILLGGVLLVYHFLVLCYLFCPVCIILAHGKCCLGLAYLLFLLVNIHLLRQCYIIRVHLFLHWLVVYIL